MFLDDTACNLASLNLLTFLEDGKFDVEAYGHATRLWTLILEISVLMAQFPSARGRPAVLRLPHPRPRLRQPRRPAHGQGIPYDSAEGRAQCGALTAIMTGASYATSAEMAAEVGPFPRYASEPRAHAARRPQPPPRGDGGHRPGTRG